MDIKRNALLSAIISANKTKDYETYTELLSILYQLIAQENINNTYIDEFFLYTKISNRAQNMLTAVSA